MKIYLLMFMGLMLLLFAMPKNNGERSFAQQVALKKDCKASKRIGKGSCSRKCLKHQTHSSQQNNAAGTAADCSQQLFAIVADRQEEGQHPPFTAPQPISPAAAKKHQPPHLDEDPDPPRYS